MGRANGLLDPSFIGGIYLKMDNEVPAVRSYRLKQEENSIRSVFSYIHIKIH
jgi:hypothetical protein